MICHGSVTDTSTVATYVATYTVHCTVLLSAIPCRVVVYCTVQYAMPIHPASCTVQHMYVKYITVVPDKRIAPRFCGRKESGRLDANLTPEEGPALLLR